MQAKLDVSGLDELASRPCQDFNISAKMLKRGAMR